jgi:hypothetical protein
MVVKVAKIDPPRDWPVPAERGVPSQKENSHGLQSVTLKRLQGPTLRLYLFLRMRFGNSHGRLSSTANESSQKSYQNEGSAYSTAAAGLRDSAITGSRLFQALSAQYQDS